MHVRYSQRDAVASWLDFFLGSLSFHFRHETEVLFCFYLGFLSSVNYCLTVRTLHHQS